MEKPRFGVPCPGEGCALKHRPESHCHMPPQDTLPNRIPPMDEETAKIAEAIYKAQDGRSGDEDFYELENSLPELLGEYALRG